MTKLIAKTLVLATIFLLIVFFSCWIIYDAYAQEWIVTNQATVSWDAVTKLSNNSTIPSDNIVEYSIYLADSDKINITEVATTKACKYTITLTTEGQYLVGLKTLRKSSDETLIGESIIGWSDDPIIAYGGHTFGLRYYLLPAVVTGLRAN